MGAVRVDRVIRGARLAVEANAAHLAVAIDRLAALCAHEQVRLVAGTGGVARDDRQCWKEL